MNHALQQHSKQKNKTIATSKPISIKHANLIKSILQPKLKIGVSNDKYEQEADRVADQVMRMPTPVQYSSINRSQTTNISNIQRKCAGCAKEDELIQKKSSGITPEVTPTINSNIQSLQGRGQPLSQSERRFFEPRFGTDFSHVRLHTGNHEASIAQSINAKAFTLGNNVVFGAGEYSTGSAGRKLMAHELTHVIQQNNISHNSTSLATQNTQPENIQRARLPCTTRKDIDVYGVNLPGSNRSIHNDISHANSILCQCGIKINIKGGESWGTNLLDIDAPLNVLNHSTTTATQEVQTMTAYRPGGNALHAYYVPSISIGSRGSSFYASRYGGGFPGTANAIQMANSAAVDTFVHELVHVLMDDGGHHRNPDNLMATGGSRNLGVDELEQSQCLRMP